MFGNVSGRTCEQYWKNIQKGFKYLAVITLAIALINIFTNLLALLLLNNIVWTVNRFHLWRIFTSFLVDTNAINVIFNIYIISTCLPSVEQRYSTAYVIIQIFAQTCLCNIVFIVVTEILSLAGLVQVEKMMAFGLSQLMFIFLWQATAFNPEELTSFCFFPCLMPMKYLPWCFLAFSILFGTNFVAVLACCLGYYQYMYLGRSLIRLPLSFYYKIEGCLPKSTKEDPGFVPIKKVQDNLQAECWRQSSSLSSDKNEFVGDMVGSGVQIGGGQGNSPSYRHFWAQQEDSNEQEMVQQSTRNLSNTNLI